MSNAVGRAKSESAGRGDRRERGARARAVHSAGETLADPSKLVHKNSTRFRRETCLRGWTPEIRNRKTSDTRTHPFPEPQRWRLRHPDPTRLAKCTNRLAITMPPQSLFTNMRSPRQQSRRAPRCIADDTESRREGRAKELHVNICVASDIYWRNPSQLK
jgi:hypothetical protein